MRRDRPPLLMEQHHEGRTGVSLPGRDPGLPAPEKILPSNWLRTEKPAIPELSELDVVRHYVKLSQLNMAIDTNFYPLGSCTMKYNPKVNDEAASLPGFSAIHPYQDPVEVPGMLSLLFHLEEMLCEIFGFARFSLQPLAGAHGELTALLLMKAYHKDRGESNRHIILVPDSAHGTNPASAAAVGWTVQQIKSDSRGGVDLEDLKAHLSGDVAGMMLTNPNTLGLFDENIKAIADLIHQHGAVLYWDGANANAVVGRVKPSDLGFDMCHINLHKTFSTPHGGGGPGAGPVGVTAPFAKYLPLPRVDRDAETGQYLWIDEDRDGTSVGKVGGFWGNAGVLVRAYTYMRALGSVGLRGVSEGAVLNANYLKEKLKKAYWLPFDRSCQHEFVLSAKWQKDKYGVRALDIAKRLIDYGFYAPTIYFPLIVPEAIMIEPTETESKETLDRFADALLAIARECENDAEMVKHAPHTTPVSRLDDVKAVKALNVCCFIGS